METNRNKQPLLHKEEINMKNPTLKNPDIRRYEGWTSLDATWPAASVCTDKVKDGEHALPRPPKTQEEDKEPNVQLFHCGPGLVISYARL